MNTLEINFGMHRLTVYRHGEGRVPLVLLHGGGVDGAMLSWREVMKALPPTYTVYAVDLLGYGNSDRPAGMEGKDFYPTHIAAIEAVADALALKRFALAGLSMGGAIAIGYALAHPERVAALIPLDAWGLVSRMPPQALYYWMTQSNMLRGAFGLFARHRALVRWTLVWALIGDRRQVTDALVDEVVDLCRKPNAEASMRDYQRSSLTRHGTVPDYTARLKDLRMPVLFVTGEKDALVKLRDVRRAADAVPGARLHVMKGCKHWAQKERPAEFADAVDAFLTEKTVW